MIKDYTGKTIKHIEFSYYETNKNRWHNLLAQITIAQGIYDEENINSSIMPRKGTYSGSILQINGDIINPYYRHGI